MKILIVAALLIMAIGVFTLGYRILKDLNGHKKD